MTNGRKFVLVLLGAVLSLISANVHAQAAKGMVWTGDKGVTESVSVIMSRPIWSEGIVPSKGQWFNPFVERPYAAPSPSGSGVSKFPLNAPLSRGGPKLPQLPGTAFDAITSGEALSTPADANGGVSPTQILTVTNGRIRVFSKAGVLGELDTSTDVFFNSVRGTFGTRGPRVRYDRITSRWYISMLSTEPINNSYLLAVSDRPEIDAQTQFTFFAFRPSDIPGSNFDTGRRIDGVSMGVDANALYLGAHVFSANFVGSDAFVVKKSSILGSGPIEVTAFRNLTGTPTGVGMFAPQGADNDDPAETEGYFVGTDNGAFGRLIVRRVTDPGGVPTLSPNLFINVPSTTLPRNVSVLGSTIPLAGGDDRLSGVRMYSNIQRGTRSMWACHSIQVNSSGVSSNGGGRNGVRWYQLDNLSSTPILLQSGTVFDPSLVTPLSFWMPSLTLSGQGHLAMASNVAGANMQVGVAGFGRFRFESPGVSQAATLIQPGAGNYNVDGFSPQRWGGYSQTVLDPSDAQTAWTFQTYVSADNQWSLRVVQLLGPPPPAITPSQTGVLRGSSQRIGLSGTFENGREFFDPGPDYPNRLQVAISGPGVTITGFELATATQIYVDLVVEPDAEASVRTLTVTNPDGQTSSVDFEIRNPLPEFFGIAPTSRPTGSPESIITATGAKFEPSSVVRVEGVDKPTTYISATEMTFVMSEEDLRIGASRSVTIFTPGPGGGTSNTQPFTIINPQPTMTALDPNLVVINSGDTTITVTGTGFVPNSVVRLGTLDLATTFESATQITCVLPASELLTPRNVRLRVFNPSPGGGGASNDLPLTIGNPVPTISSFTPDSAAVGTGDLLLTVNGTNFLASSIIRFAGVDRETTVVSDTELTTVIPATEFMVAGTRTVRVVNPAPGGGIAGPLTFNVTNATPELETITPDTAPVNSASFTLQVTGAQFLPTSIIRWNGLDRATTFIDAQSLSCTIPAGFLTVPGSYPITVFTPGPGAMPSNAIPFTVTRPNAIVTSLTPNPVLRGGPDFTLTVNGSNIFPGCAVRVNGSDRPTTYVSSTRATATLSAADIAETGTLNISLMNSGPGDDSNALPLQVNNPVPVLSSLAPNEVPAGSPDVEVTLAGSSFFPDSVVRIGGTDVTTTYDSPTQLRATIPQATLVSSRTLLINVFNPLPGGGQSSSQQFRVINPVPTIESINPPVILAGGPGFTLTVTGTSFVPNSEVTWNQLPRVTTYVSPTELSIQVPAGDYANTGGAFIRVRNPGPGGGTTSHIELLFPNPAPDLVSISPQEIPVNSGAFTLTVTGSNFVTGSIIRWNGLDRSTTFINSNTLRCTIPAGFLTGAGTFPVNVWNNTPGGGLSPTVMFTVTGPPPTITALNPSSAIQYDAAFEMTVTGTGLAAGAIARIDGRDCPTTFISSTQVQVTVTDEDLENPGVLAVTVRNPGSSNSNALPLTVNAAFPILDSSSPDHIMAGGPDAEVILTGDNFVPASVARLDGVDLVTTYDSQTQLRATLPAAMTASGKFSRLTVFTPAPGGGESGTVNFTVFNPLPAMDSINPQVVTAGTGSFTLIVTGSNFVPTSTITWNQAPKATTFISSTELHAAIPAADVLSGGSAFIRVFSPTPGGGTAGPIQINFVNPVPVITSLSPGHKSAGGGDFTLTVFGSGFTGSSVITWRGPGKSTTFISPNELRATILASDYATPGTATVRVSTPGPGGGTTNAYIFSIGPAGSSLVLPTEYEVVSGDILDGELSHLFNLDEAYVSVFNDPITLVAQVIVRAVSPTATPSAMMLESEVAVDRGGLAQTIHLYNYSGARWQLFESSVASSQDRYLQVNVPAPAQFVGPGQEIQYRVTWSPINDEDPSQDGWPHRLDVVRWHIAP